MPVPISRRRVYRPFRPDQVPGLTQWLDAADRSTISLATGINQWSDKSVVGLHATQGTGGSQPAYTLNSLNGLPCVTFDGTDDFLSSASISLGEITIFAVVSARWTVSENAQFWGQNWTTNKAVGRTGSAGFDYLTNDLRAVTNSFNSGTAGPRSIGPQPSGLVDGQAIQVTARLGASGTSIRCNGVSIARVARNDPTTPVNFPVAIGRPGSGYNSEYWNGRIAELILYAGIVDDGPMMRVESYMKSKWGPP